MTQNALANVQTNVLNTFTNLSKNIFFITQLLIFKIIDIIWYIFT